MTFLILEETSSLSAKVAKLEKIEPGTSGHLPCHNKKPVAE